MPIIMQDKGIAVLLLLACLYNFLLSAVNANFFMVNNALVMLFELAVLGGSLFIILYYGGFKEQDRLALLLIFAIIIALCLTFIASGVIFVDALRNFLIVTLFLCLGRRVSQKMFHSAVMVLSLVVYVFLLIECFNLSTYVSLLEPAQYYQNTRGVAISEFNQTGVFGNAEGFEGRFTYGVFTGPRTSSVFLEQVGLANFSLVLGMYLLIFGRMLTTKLTLFYISLILLICLSNETRVGSAINFLFLSIALFRNLLPSYSNLLIPFICLYSGFAVSSFYADAYGDDLLGRINLSFSHLFELKMVDLLGAGVLKLNAFWDSGYAYLLASSTILGAVVFVFLILFLLPQISVEGRLCAFALSCYIFVNMMIGGNAIYSIKTAALLWFIVGHVYELEQRELYA